jgi:protocatechuate 3,4-dioxygenase beta subunit
MNRLLPGSSRTRVLLATLLTAVLGVTGFGVMPTASAAPEGSIEGTVTDADGAGIKGIEVTAYEFDGVDAWTNVSSTTTKNDGSYSLKKLPAASYQVQFDDSEGTYVTEFYDDQPTIDLADDVEVAQGEDVAGIDAQLTRTGTIRGTVTDEQGQPLEGIFIDILTVDEDGFPTGSPNGGMTNAAGVYVVPFIAPGDYVVGFTDLGGTYVNEYYDDHISVFDSDLVAVTPAGVTEDIDAALSLGGHISGTVTDSRGDPIPDIEIDLARLVDGEWFSFGEEFGFDTQADGTYQVDGLPAGTWQVGFFDPEGNYLGEYYDDQPTSDTATNLVLSAGGSQSDIDATLDDAAHVRGTVTDAADQPIEGIFVTVWTPSPIDGHLEIAGDTETAADGTYSIDGLRSGDYRVQFESDGDYANEYYDDVLTIDHATVLDVDTGEVVDDIDAQLVDAAHLTGTVTGVGGELLPLAAVIAYARHDGHWDDVGIAFADERNSGNYDLGGLSPGTYRLEFFSFRIEDDDGNVIGINADEFWDDQPTLELAQDIVLSEAGEVQNGFDAVLEDGQYPSDVANLMPPTISGSPVVGQTLTASPGTWNLAATTFHYQWFAGTTPVGSGTPAYSPTAADVGKTITVTVVGSVAGLGSAAATSAPTAPVTGTSVTPPPPPAPKQIANLKLPVIKGTLEAGRRARVTTGRWSPSEVDLTYRWFVGGKSIAKSDHRKLVLKEKWVGKRLKVKVVATADGYLKSMVVTQRSAKIKP